MKLILRRTTGVFFLWTLILFACSAIPASPQPVPSSPSETPVPFATTVIPDIIKTLSTPHIEQPPDGLPTTAPPDSQNCGYQWAYQDLPELSASFQHSIQALAPGAEADAFVFGENCVLSDGTVARFIPMETDFSVILPVDDVANETALGEWIIKVVQVIEAIPAEQIVGPRPGRVSIIFQSSTTQGGVNFYRDQYQGLPAGLSPAETYQALKTSR